MCTRQSFIAAFALLFFTIQPNPGYATDYQSMTTEELSHIRGTLSDASQAERDAFRAEWLKRVDQMTPEERTRYTGPGGGRGTGPRDGSGVGFHGSDDPRNGQGQGAGKGSGNNGNGNRGGGQGGRGPQR